MNIYVGNLPYSMTEQELSSIFTEYGAVNTAKIITDRETGRSRGFGFVEMPDSAARKAIEELNGSEYDGKQLTINEAQERKPNTRGGGGGGGFDHNRRSRY
jgi:RNA recognition motif-containing protein